MTNNGKELTSRRWNTFSESSNPLQSSNVKDTIRGKHVDMLVSEQLQKARSKRFAFFPLCSSVISCVVAINLLLPYRLLFNVVDVYDRIKAKGGWTRPEKTILEQSDHEVTLSSIGEEENNDYHQARLDLLHQRTELLKNFTDVVLYGTANNILECNLNTTPDYPLTENVLDSDLPYWIEKLYSIQNNMHDSININY